MSPEGIGENFGDSHCCKNLKFENFSESRTHLCELQGTLGITRTLKREIYVHVLMNLCL